MEFARIEGQDLLMSQSDAGFARDSSSGLRGLWEGVQQLSVTVTAAASDAVVSRRPVWVV